MRCPPCHAPTMPSSLTVYQASVQALQHYRAVMSRAKRIQRRVHRGPGRPPKITLDVAIAMVCEDIKATDARAAERAARLAACPAPAPRDPATSAVREDRALARAARWRARNPEYFRARRLKARGASMGEALGVAADVWSEIVDHFRACCAACGAPASRVARLADGTPVPACVAHDGHVVRP